MPGQMEDVVQRASIADAAQAPTLPTEIQRRIPLAMERAAAKVAACPPDRTAARLLRAAQGARSARQRTIWIHRMASAWVKPFEAVTPCRRGCSHCCHLPVAITTSEARLLAQASGRAQAEPADAVPIARLDEQDTLTRAEGLMRRTTTSACPFLDGEGACSVYEHRPVACRTHLTLDDDDLLCRLIDGAEIPVPYLGVQDVWLLHLSAHSNDMLADVRDFFPS